MIWWRALCRHDHLNPPSVTVRVSYVARGGPRDIGEHALTKWFVRQFFLYDDQPYRAEIGNRPILKRDGSPWESSHFPPVQLPCCISCNGTLNSRFEQPAKSVIRRLFTDGGTEVFSARSGRSVAS